MLLSIGFVLLLLVVGSYADCKSQTSTYAAPYDLSTSPTTLTVDSPVFTGGKYYIQPCGSVDVSLCPYSTGMQQCFSVMTWELVSDGLGAADKTTWTPLNGDWASGAVSVNSDIAYDYDQCNADPGTNSFTVTYMCDKGDNSVTVVKEPTADKNGPCIFEFTVDSSVVCGGSGGGGGGSSSSKKSLSGGWIFVIILVVVFSVYMIGGISWNKYKKNLAGAELLPHRDFWRELPGLTKDGCIYFVMKCKSLCGRGSTGGESSFTSM